MNGRAEPPVPEHHPSARALSDWMLGEGRTLELPALIESLAYRMVAAGVPLDRFSVSFSVLNPALLASGIVWRREQPLLFTRFAYAHRNDGVYERSPFKVARESGEWLRLDLAETPDDRFDVVPDLKAAALAHYTVIPDEDSAGGPNYITMATRERSGFTAEHEAFVSAILPALRAVTEVKTLRSTLDNILSAYVGAGPAKQIVSGSVHLGQVTRVRAAILLADLRGFTHLSTRLPPEATADVINRYYDIIVPAVSRHGGEVLKFIGDAVLAIFPSEDGGDEAAALRGLDAAHEALGTEVEPFEAAGSTVTIRFGVGLHLGEAVFGNVGSGERLDFTVIGRDVNIAARIAALCSRLGCDFLVSDSVAAVERRRGRPVASAGEHLVRGLDVPLRVHVPGVTEVAASLDDGVSQGLVLAPD